MTKHKFSFCCPSSYADLSLFGPSLPAHRSLCTVSTWVKICVCWLAKNINFKILNIKILNFSYDRIEAYVYENILMSANVIKVDCA